MVCFHCAEDLAVLIHKPNEEITDSFHFSGHWLLVLELSIVRIKHPGCININEMTQGEMGTFKFVFHIRGNHLQHYQKERKN